MGGRQGVRIKDIKGHGNLGVEESGHFSFLDFLCFLFSTSEHCNNICEENKTNFFKFKLTPKKV